jgi:hypothetical protein
VASLQPLYDICAKDGIMLFGMDCYTQKQWCKRECFQTMGQDEPKYHEATACCATYMLFQKPALSTRSLPMQLLWEWFTYSHNPVATTFRDSLHLGNDAAFKEHRNEQAILGNLAHKYGYKLWPMAEHGGSGHYPAIFHQLHGKTYGPERGHGSAFRNVND